MFPVRPSRLEHDVLTLHVAQLAQALSARLPQVSALCGSEGEEVADTRNSLRLLRREAERGRQHAHPNRKDEGSSVHTVSQEHN